MRILAFAFVILSMQSADAQDIDEYHNPKKYPNTVNRTFVKSLNGKPINFYLKRSDIDGPAKKFYKGERGMFDDDDSFAFMDSVMTRNRITQPFYFFVFNRVNDIADGSIAETLSEKARRYVEASPCQFLVNVKNPQYKTSLDKWIPLVGFEIYASGEYDKFTVEVERKINAGCSTEITSWEHMKSGILEYVEKNK